MPQQIVYSNRKLMPLYESATDPTPTLPVKLVQGTYIMGQVVEESGTPGTYRALTSDANAQLLLQYDVAVSADGFHFPGGQLWSETGVGDTATSAFAPGGALSFDTRDLSKDNTGTDITAAIVTALKGLLVSGTPEAGIIQF